jgi:hypothetical protein
MFGPGIGSATSDAGPQPPQYLGFSPNNHAATFDGANTWVDTQLQLLQDRSAFTLEYWVKPAGRANFPTRVGIVGQNDAVEYGFIDPNTIQIWTPNGGSLSTAYSFADGEWHHVATIADGSSISTYYDGVLAGSESTTTTDYGASTFNVHIGGGGVFDDAGNFFNGQIDEVAIFDKAISADRIAAHYKAGVEGAVPPSPSITLAGPAAYSSYPEGGDVPFSVTVEDPVGLGVTVSYFANGQKVAESSSSPYSATWVKAPAGVYTVDAQVTDKAGDTATSGSVKVVVGTYPVSNEPPDVVLNHPGTVFIEAEDYNYDSGKYVSGANGGPTGQPYDVGAYAGLQGVAGVDYDVGTGGGGGGIVYREDPSDAAIGPATTDFPDLNRGSFSVTNNWKLGWNDAGEWENYTREFPATPTEYDVYARLASGGTDPNPTLSLVTSDPTQPNQTLQELGGFDGGASGDWGTMLFYTMHAPGDPATPQTVTLSGVKTLRLSVGSGNYDVNYLAFVPHQAVVVAPKFTTIDLGSGNVTLEWSGGGTLQSADAVTGPWTDVANASSPYSAPASAARRFYRVKR